MNAPLLRFDPVAVRPDPTGSCVMFKDIEAALGDRELLDWLLPIVDGKNAVAADLRTMSLTLGVLKGLQGRELVRFAMNKLQSVTQ